MIANKKVQNKINVSVVCFPLSEVYQEQPFLVKSADVGNGPMEEAATAKIPVVVNLININGGQDKDTTGLQPAVTEEEDDDGQSKYVGLIIGILLTLISLLVAGIFWVVFKGGGGIRGKETPTTHSLLASKIQDRLAASIDFKVGTVVLKIIIGISFFNFTLYFCLGYFKTRK